MRGEENDNLRSNTLEERVGNLEAIQRAAHNRQVATDVSAAHIDCLTMASRHAAF